MYYKYPRNSLFSAEVSHQLYGEGIVGKVANYGRVKSVQLRGPERILHTCFTPNLRNFSLNSD